MMTARGKIQRIAAGEISVIGRNTQGVRIMSLDDGDTLAAVVRVPRDAAAGAVAVAEAAPIGGVARHRLRLASTDRMQVEPGRTIHRSLTAGWYRLKGVS